MSIEFQEIPASIRIPGTYVEVDTRLRNRGLPSTDYKLLLIGQLQLCAAMQSSQQRKCYKDEMLHLSSLNADGSLCALRHAESCDKCIDSC